VQHRSPFQFTPRKRLALRLGTPGRGADTETRDQLKATFTNIRIQVSADIRSRIRFMSAPARERANVLLAEIRRRQLSVTPIYWPDAQLMFC
jgi:hypothetical protein